MQVRTRRQTCAPVIRVGREHPIRLRVQGRQHAGQIVLVPKLFLAYVLHEGCAVRSLELALEFLHEGCTIGALRYLRANGGKFVQDVLSGDPQPVQGLCGARHRLDERRILVFDLLGLMRLHVYFGAPILSRLLASYHTRRAPLFV